MNIHRFTFAKVMTKLHAVFLRHRAQNTLNRNANNEIHECINILR